MCYQVLYQVAHKVATSDNPLKRTINRAHDLQAFAQATRTVRQGCRSTGQCGPLAYHFHTPTAQRCALCHTLACIEVFPELSLHIVDKTTLRQEREPTKRKRTESGGETVVSANPWGPQTGLVALPQPSAAAVTAFAQQEALPHSPFLPATTMFPICDKLRWKYPRQSLSEVDLDLLEADLEGFDVAAQLFIPGMLGCTEL